MVMAGHNRDRNWVQAMYGILYKAEEHEKELQCKHYYDGSSLLIYDVVVIAISVPTYRRYRLPPYFRKSTSHALRIVPTDHWFGLFPFAD